MTPDARFERPMYSYAEADRIAGVKTRTTSRWVREYVRTSDSAHSVPDDGEAEPGASFFDLIEVAAVGRLRAAGWPFKAIHAAVESCRQMSGLPRPLVSEQFQAHGHDVFTARHEGLDHAGIGPRKCEAAWFEVLVPFLKTVAYEHQYARRWWPIGRDRHVVVDPDYGFGLPVIQGSGVRTEIVYEQVRALESQERIAYSFNISPEDVEHAIQFEASRTPE